MQAVDEIAHGYRDFVYLQYPYSAYDNQIWQDKLIRLGKVHMRGWYAVKEVSNMTCSSLPNSVSKLDYDKKR